MSFFQDRLAEVKLLQVLCAFNINSAKSQQIVLVFEGTELLPYVSGLSHGIHTMTVHSGNLSIDGVQVR